MRSTAPAFTCLTVALTLAAAAAAEPAAPGGAEPAGPEANPCERLPYEWRIRCEQAAQPAPPSAATSDGSNAPEPVAAAQSGDEAGTSSGDVPQ